MRIFFLFLVSVFVILATHYLYDMPTKLDKFTLCNSACNKMCNPNFNLVDLMAMVWLESEEKWITNGPEHEEQWGEYCSTCCYRHTYPIHDIIYEDPAAIIIWDLISDWEFQFAQIIMRDWNRSHIP